MDSTLEDIQMSVKRLISQPFEEKNLNHITMLYHYTTAEGLKGIIDNNSFFASRSDFLNDYTEMQYCWDLFLEVVESKRKECGTSLGTPNTDSVFYDDLITEANKYRVEIVDLEEFFVISFTKNGDSLATWSHYAGSDGYNIAIDLRPNVEMWKRLSDLQFRYGAVIYDKEKQIEILKREISQALLIWQGIEFPGRKYDYLIVDALLYRIKIWMMFLKNNLFEQEQEVRVAFFRPNYEFLSQKLGKELYAIFPEHSAAELETKVAQMSSTYTPENHKKQFRLRNNIIYPYIVINVDINSIMGVKVGPTNTIDKALLGVNMYLDSKGLREKEVTRSKCPLRF